MDKLEAYLKAYLTVLKKQDWVHTIYFDAFAGTGTAPIAAKSEPTLPLDDDAATFIVGSVRRALELDLSFSEYVFVEKGRAKARELDRLKTAYPAKADRIKIENTDANSGGVLDEWLVLGRKRHHSYSLIFAWANPSTGAKKAGTIARAVIRSGEHGRTKRN